MRTLGEVVYIYNDTEDFYIIIVMVNDKGVRYIDPDNLEFDDDGYMRTRYATHENIDEWASVSCGTVKELADLFKFVSQTYGQASH